MLSAESASGNHPVEAVAIMDSIIRAVEHDPAWREGLETSHSPARATTPDAICCALRRVASLLRPAATVAYTASGFSALRASRERPDTPILALTPNPAVARQLTLAWGVHPFCFPAQLNDVDAMISQAVDAAMQRRLAQPGDTLVIIAGLPFGRSGSTNLLHVAQAPAGPRP